MNWFPILYGLVFGVVVGVAMVEYSRWRMKRMITSMVEDFMRRVKEDGEMEARIKQLVDRVVDYAIDHIKQRLSEGGDPPSIRKYIDLAKRSSD